MTDNFAHDDLSKDFQYCEPYLSMPDRMLFCGRTVYKTRRLSTGQLYVAATDRRGNELTTKAYTDYKDAVHTSPGDCTESQRHAIRDFLNGVARIASGPARVLEDYKDRLTAYESGIARRGRIASIAQAVADRDARKLTVDGVSLSLQLATPLSFFDDRPVAAETSVLNTSVSSLYSFLEDFRKREADIRRNLDQLEEYFGRAVRNFEEIRKEYGGIGPCVLFDGSTACVAHPSFGTRPYANYTRCNLLIGYTCHDKSVEDAMSLVSLACTRSLTPRGRNLACLHEDLRNMALEGGGYLDLVASETGPVYWDTARRTLAPVAGRAVFVPLDGFLDFLQERLSGHSVELQ